MTVGMKSKWLVALVVACSLTACKDRAAEERQKVATQAADSMAKLRAEGKTDLSNPEMGGKVLATITETGLVLSHAHVPHGQVTFAVVNSTKAAKVAQVSGHSGTWRTMTLRPGETILLAMILDTGIFKVTCPDSTGKAEACKGTQIKAD